MPGFAEMLYGTAEAGTPKAQGIDQTFIQASELAQRKEVHEQNKKQFELEKQKLTDAKLSKTFDFLKDAKNYKGGARNNHLKAAIKYRDSLGISSNLLPDDVIMGLGYDENMGKLATLEYKILTRELKPKEGIAILNNKEAFNKLAITPNELINEDPDVRGAVKLVEGWNQQEKMSASRQRQERGVALDKQRLLKTVNDQGIFELEVNFNDLEKLIPNGLQGWKKGQHIAGISGIEGGMDPQTDQARKVRQTAMGIINAMMRMRVGLNQTEQEEVRTMVMEMGMIPLINERGMWLGRFTGKLKTNEDSFMNGMRKAQQYYLRRTDGLRNTFPAVYDEVMRNPRGESTSIIPPQSSQIKMGNQLVPREVALRFKAAYPNSKMAKQIDAQLNPNTSNVRVSEDTSIEAEEAEMAADEEDETAVTGD